MAIEALKSVGAVYQASSTPEVAKETSQPKTQIIDIQTGAAAMAADAAPALILGNAADKYTYDGKLRKLDEIWDNTDIKKEFAGCHVYSKPSCRDCWAKFYCSGGCSANSYNFNGTINGTYEIGCKLERKRVECALMVKAALALEEETENEEA